MPRKLPWKNTGRSTVVSRPKTSSNQKPPKKRVKVSTPASETDDNEVSEPIKGERLTDRAPSISPPPEPPSECFMEEGIDHDDKYRMVEDEFLSIAQKFTVHLHAAEYKKQKAMVKARNAQMIDSISRPVTGKMPDHTKRKLESLTKSKAQRSLMEGFLGKKSEEGDDSDSDVGLPYVGTTLHGLMDAPKRKSASLAKVQPATAATRAAAGFQTTAALSKSSRCSTSESPDSKFIPRFGVRNQKDATLTESSDGDDDLDAPTRPLKLSSFDHKPPSVQVKPEMPLPVSSPSKLGQSSIFARPQKKPSTIDALTSGIKPGSKLDQLDIKDDSSDEERKARIARNARRLRYSGSERVKQDEQEEQKKKSLDVIPTFM